MVLQKSFVVEVWNSSIFDISTNKINTRKQKQWQTCRQRWLCKCPEGWGAGVQTVSESLWRVEKAGGLFGWGSRPPDLESSLISWQNQEKASAEIVPSPWPSECLPGWRLARWSPESRWCHTWGESSPTRHQDGLASWPAWPATKHFYKVSSKYFPMYQTTHNLPPFID